MYTLEDMRRFPLWPKNQFRLNYDVDFDGDNYEWRECVTHILNVLEKIYPIEVISESPFEPYEDFVELIYLIGDEKITIGNDFAFSTIWIQADSVEFALEIKNILSQGVHLPKERLLKPNHSITEMNTLSDSESHITDTEIVSDYSKNLQPYQLNKNFMSNNLIKETGTWKWGVLCLVFLAPFFFLTYGFANQYASGLSDVPSIVFAWEKHIPLWAWTIVPYWSIDLFYGLSLLLCWNKFELKQQALRLFLAQVISISCFLLFPLKFSFERPPLDGFFGLWFDVLMGFDKPFNQAPSLHIVLLIILWDFYRRHVQGTWKYLVDFWCVLIGISVLTTWQHHFIDLPTGILVGALCLWLFPISVKSPFRKDGLQLLTAKHLKLGSYYLCGSVIFFILAYEFRSWGLWLIYPAVSLFIVAHSYSFVRPHFFQKQETGKMTVAAQMLLAPYLIFAWFNSRVWTKKHPEDSFIIQHELKKIYIGRIPTQQDHHQYNAIFDCVAELPLNQATAYQQYLSLDLIPLQANQLELAVARLNDLMSKLEPSSTQNILIFCALGYSRSSAVLTAWLIQQNQDANIDEMVNIIRKARPWVVLKQAQLEELEIYHLKLKGLAP